MIRTQIQLPDPLYRQVKRVAELEDWSIAEVIRRGAEHITKNYPEIKESDGNEQLPAPIQARLLIQDPAAIKEALLADYDK